MKLKDLFKEKGIFSGKKVLAITMALTFVGGMTLGAAASNHTWGSTGNVVYDNNGTKTTVFNKQDLVYLDDRISTIEASVDTGKVNIAEKLNEWELPADKIVPTTNPSFDQINAVLEYIKSIPNAGKEWKDASNNSYYVKEDGSLTTNASEAKKNADGNAEPLKIAAATAGNLSAGSAAWVNGSLIIGDGSDNKNYYNSVYGTKYIEVLSIVCVAAQFNTDQFPDQNYNVLINRQIYDPNHLGDQKLLSASGYYSSGWRVSLSVSSKASYHNYGSGMLLNGAGGNPVYRIVIATL